MPATVDVERDSGALVELSAQHCVVVWIFALSEERKQEFDALSGQFCEHSDAEPKCLYHRFSYNGKRVHYRVATQDAFGVLAHVVDMWEVLKTARETIELERLEIHGPEDQLEQLREPLAAFDPDFFVSGFCTNAGGSAP